MLDAGMPILRSAPTSVSGIKGELAAAFRELAENVTLGGDLSKAMARYPKIFTPIELLVVEAGEMSGNLAQSLKQLAQWHTFCYRLKYSTLSKMVFPCMVLHIAAVMVPAPALILGRIGTTQYLFQMLQPLVFFYGVIAAIIFIFKFTPRTGFLRKALDSTILKIPIIGLAAQQLALSRYCRVFYMLHSGGIPIIQCTQKASEHTGNVVVTAMLEGGARSAAAGKSVSAGFSPQLPREFIERWRIGEETGSLDNVLKRMVENTSETSERIIEELGNWAPKIFYFFVCLYMIANIFRNFAML
jgi:type IV pilus assembly protein PilC